MTQPAYMQERWFALLQAACAARGAPVRVAGQLGVAVSLVYQVLNASGHYGTGKASTEKFALKVLHQLGNYECPHLTEQHGEQRVISSDECRAYAHRNPPIGSPRDLAHWQACRKCPHYALAAPAPPRQPVPRKPKAPQASTTPMQESPAP